MFSVIRNVLYNDSLRMPVVGITMSRSYATFVKNVYKAIGYEAPFSVDEKETVLEKVNHMDETTLYGQINKQQAVRIYNHRKGCIQRIIYKSKGVSTDSKNW